MPWQTWWLIEVQIDFGNGVYPGGRVVQGGRDGLLHIDHVVVAQAVELAGGHAGLDERFDVVEDFGCQTAGHPHSFDFFGCLYGDAHVGVGVPMVLDEVDRLSHAPLPGKPRAAGALSPAIRTC